MSKCLIIFPTWREAIIHQVSGSNASKIIAALLLCCAESERLLDSFTCPRDGYVGFPEWHTRTMKPREIARTRQISKMNMEHGWGLNLLTVLHLFLHDRARWASMNLHLSPWSLWSMSVTRPHSRFIWVPNRLLCGQGNPVSFKLHNESVRHLTYLSKVGHGGNFSKNTQETEHSVNGQIPTHSGTVKNKVYTKNQEI